MLPTHVSLRARLGAALLVAASSLAGCKSCGNDGGAGPAASASSSAEPPASAVGSAARPDRHRFRGFGVTGMLLGGARELDLKPEQIAKLDEVQKTLRGDDASSRDEMRAYNTELAAQIKAGKIEAAKLEPHYAALDKAAKDRQDKEAEALNALYAALEPAQRTALVARMRSREAAREERVDGGVRLSGRDGGIEGRLGRLTRHLELDAAQQKKVEAMALKVDAGANDADGARAEMKKRMDAILGPFDKEGFDAKKLHAAEAKKGRAQAEDDAKLVAQLLPILQPAQREKLSESTERGHRVGRREHGRGGSDRRPGSDDDDDD